MLDASTRAGRVGGVARIYPLGTTGVQWVAGSAGSIPADLSGGTPFWMFTPDWLFQHVSQNAPVPIVSVDAYGVSWRYSASSGNFYTPMPGLLVYGVY
ncbi:hypothetical protein NIB78_03015 [Burkholderia multivorans]|nr:hypothetical protein [Burkholderia multivorans]MCO7335480.1 hypothetical protein [Burkholderia multivorans]MCO7341087.1 hypothetical protein [Burkholderia multivorans]MCO7344727.1 hypothetical protein [Burkholderia multivorans]PRF38978.1 hypothetical protein C6Q08_01495 [Burkholderia multivorans]